MLTYDMLARKPGAFKSMTGLTVQEFEDLLRDLCPHYEAARQEQIATMPRRRAPGGGAKPRYNLRERLLMTLVWLRLYLTCDAVGVLFAVDKSTVSRSTQPLLRLLRDRGQETLGWPEEARAILQAPEAESISSPEPIASMGGMITDRPAPEVECVSATPTEAPMPEDSVAIIDATEQRVERARDNVTQKAHYSGKKKAHTRKTLLIVNEHGRLRYVSASVPGAVHDVTLLRQCGALEEIPPDLSLMADSGFQGLQNDVPQRSVALPYKSSRHHPLTPEQKLQNATLSRIRIVVENTLAEMKHFRILADVFRHSVALYDSIFVTVAGVITRRADRRLAELPVAA